MSELAIRGGAVAPLFDRLRAAKSQAERRPLRALSRQELRESVCRELEWLLSTRSSLPATQYATATLSVLDYGLPDTSAFAPGSSADRERLGLLLTRAVATFEPRLSDVSATVAVAPEQPQTLQVTLGGRLLGEPVVVSLLLSLTGDKRPDVALQPLDP